MTAVTGTPSRSLPIGRLTLIFSMIAFFGAATLIVARLLALNYLTLGWLSARLAEQPQLQALAMAVLPLLLSMLIFAPPVILGWYLAEMAVVSLLYVLYDLADEAQARDMLTRLVSGRGTDKALLINPATFDKDKADKPLLRVGGPGSVIVGAGNVIITERNGRFRRVLGAGKHDLGHFEYVHSVLDLRQQERNRWEEGNREVTGIVRLVTQDGIQMHAHVTVIFRICTDDESCLPEDDALNPDEPIAPTLPTRDQPYPFGERAARRAAYAQTVWGTQNGDERVAFWSWADLTAAIAVEELKIAAASHALEDLVYPQNPNAQPHLVLQGAMETNTRRRVRRFGVQLINARIDELALPEKVTDQLIRTWQAPREKRRKVQAAGVEARAEADLEVASAEQREAILLGLLEGIKRAQIDQDVAGVTREAVALRVASALENLQRYRREHNQNRS